MAGKFIQIIEYRTSKPDEVNQTMNEWSEAAGAKTKAVRSATTQDRDAQGTYLQIVEFPSYEQAMRNSDMPETQSFSDRFAKLCDGPPTFRNLDVVREDTF
jgi:hypothetical protein